VFNCSLKLHFTISKPLIAQISPTSPLLTLGRLHVTGDVIKTYPRATYGVCGGSCKSTGSLARPWNGSHIQNSNGGHNSVNLL